MEPKRIAVIVQARVGSTRLPGKVLKPFGDSTVLQHILRRLRIGPREVDLWTATTEEPEDDVIVELCRRENVGCVRGPTDDVLQRFVTCMDSMSYRPDLIVRVCADRPFICSRLLAEMLDFYTLVEEPDYLSNNLPRSFPTGLDLEIMKPDVLYETLSLGPSPIQREHVTLYVYNHPERFRLANFPCPFGNYRWARAVIDTQLDYDTLFPVQRELEQLRREYDYLDVLNFVSLNPQMFEPNRDVPQLEFPIHDNT
jgi:spore coat polysaccharide biosynthesis protein SpsF